MDNISMLIVLITINIVINSIFRIIKNKKARNKSRFINKTVYVDVQFGDDISGRISQPDYPFKTITKAVETISKYYRDVDKQWLIKVAPGIYEENVTIPQYINLAGSSENLVYLQAITITGTSKISDITLSGNKLPLITTSLYNNKPEQNQIVFKTIKISYSITNTDNKPIISINGEGINNSVEFDNSIISGEISNVNPCTSKQILFDINAFLVLNSVDIEHRGDSQSYINLFNINDQTEIRGGSFRLNVNNYPQKEVVLYNVKNGSINISNNISAINVLGLKGSYQADVSYVKMNYANSATVTNSTAWLSGVNPDFLNLVDNANEFSIINLIGLNVIAQKPGPFPRIKGHTGSVKYVLHSENGDIALNGSVASNILKIDNVDSYMVQPTDTTLLSNGVNVNIYDPKLAVSEATDKGKIIVVKNIGKTSLTIASENDTIFDSDTITLWSNDAVTLQNNNFEWFVIGKYIANTT
jgi:hypothetical protein